jgi:hypothetical protein
VKDQTNALNFVTSITETTCKSCIQFAGFHLGKFVQLEKLLASEPSTTLSSTKRRFGNADEQAISSPLHYFLLVVFSMLKMWGFYMSPSISTTLFTGLALLFTILSQLFFTQRSELLSELLSWLILPLVFNLTDQLEVSGQYKNAQVDNTPQSESSRSLWVLAFCLSFSSFYKAEYGLILLYVSLVLRDDVSHELMIASRYCCHWFKQPRHTFDTIHPSAHVDPNHQQTRCSSAYAVQFSLPSYCHTKISRVPACRLLRFLCNF